MVTRKEDVTVGRDPQCHWIWGNPATIFVMSLTLCLALFPLASIIVEYYAAAICELEWVSQTRCTLWGKRATFVRDDRYHPLWAVLNR